MNTASSPRPVLDRDRVQRRTVALLSLAQLFSGLGTGVVVSTGSLLAVELSGSKAWAGSITTAMTLGTAIAAAVLMRVALARGRRVSLAAGLLLSALGSAGVIAAAVLAHFWLFLLSGLLIGFGQAVNLQARFAATDLASEQHSGRDLSLVVWMVTVGSVAGPNLVGVGTRIADGIGIPELAGTFVLSMAGMLTAMMVIAVGLRPDPYLTAVALSSESAAAPPERSITRGVRTLVTNRRTRAALGGIVASHAVMVSVMSMTPVALHTHGAPLGWVGLVVSLHIAGMYALAPVMGTLTDRFGGPAVTLAGMATLILAALMAAFAGSNHLVMLVALILLGVGWSAATVAGSQLIVENTALHERVSAQGASDMLMSLAGALGGALAGVVVQFLAFTGLGIIAAVIAASAMPALVIQTRTAEGPAHA